MNKYKNNVALCATTVGMCGKQVAAPSRAPRTRRSKPVSIRGAVLRSWMDLRGAVEAAGGMLDVRAEVLRELGGYGALKSNVRTVLVDELRQVGLGCAAAPNGTVTLVDGYFPIAAHALVTLMLDRR